MDDIDRFLFEDLKDIGDITSENLFSDEKGKAVIIAKENCVLAGLEEAKLVFKKTGAKLTSNFKDGVNVKKNQKVAEISGPVISILKGERLALNIICRMSGIATETKKLIDLCKKVNPKIEISATRKTTPGFRKYEKKAVKIGGGKTHRYGLFDEFLIKDNHIKLTGSVEKALSKIIENKNNRIVEIEIENKKDALTAAGLNPDVIMIDNLKLNKSKDIAKKIKEINSNIKIEISGGITMDNIIDYAKFADRISLGYITHSIKSKDFSLEII
ncbi:carboxylating nicotinate-nucleotide diphosphorylase [Candidatus Woesearchaeota archaeon]|nr:carboxylating nicotinate-nucleotide diphosphorylase [Candidatus Woesearchaeota archaeon]